MMINKTYNIYDILFFLVTSYNPDGLVYKVHDANTDQWCIHHFHDSSFVRCGSFTSRKSTGSKAFCNSTTSYFLKLLIAAIAILVQFERSL